MLSGVILLIIKSCKEYYKEYGFNTLIVWEKELLNIDSLTKKLNYFIVGKEVENKLCLH